MALPDTMAVTPASFAAADDAGPVRSRPYESGPAGYREAAYAAPAHASPQLAGLIEQYADIYEVPPELVRRVVKRESNFRPAARNGPYWGLMQIRHDTARGMGYDGPASGLLDAETNLKYAVKYLRGAYITADGNQDQAVRFYARGYYYDAKRKGLLEETGLRPAKRKRIPETAVAQAEPAAGKLPAKAAMPAARGASPTAATATAARTDADASFDARFGGSDTADPAEGPGLTGAAQP